MRYIKTIDDITKDGDVEFGEGYEFVENTEDADAILMRSTDLHGYELPESIRAIARCGAGVNNIPIEEYAKQGVVVFNSPGANANAVKEIVLAMMIMSSRGIVQSMEWVRNNADDPDILVNAEKAKKAFVGHELKGKRVGVIGLGNVGSKVANACVYLGMDVYGYDRSSPLSTPGRSPRTCSAWARSRICAAAATTSRCTCPAKPTRWHDLHRAARPARPGRRAHQLRARDHCR